MKIFN